jgi:hypothetical protein
LQIEDSLWCDPNGKAGIMLVQRYFVDLLYPVLNGSLDVSPIFTSTVALADVVAGYGGWTRDGT